MTYSPQWLLSGKPYPVQIEALKRSYGHDKFAYFLSQGLGKTALLINEYVERHADTIDTVVIICPQTYKLDWAAGPEEWGLRGIKCNVWPRDEFKLGKKGEPTFFVVNFEAIRGSAFEPVKKLIEARPSALVVDESSYIKNYRSQTARAVLDLAKRAKVVRLLNGTPMSQNVLDLFAQLKCVGELDGVNPYVFRNRFAVTGGYMGRQIIGVQNEEELQRIMKRVSFRATKEDWGDLPDKVVVPVRLEMTPKQRKIYNEMMRDFFTLVDGQEFSADMVISRMGKLREITSGIILDGDQHKLIEDPKDNPKIKAELDIIAAGDGKVIIVHYYSKMGQVIFEQMALNKLAPAYIRGGMRPEEVVEQKRRFNNDSDCRVMVAQITAASRAHTLIGGEGSDRAHRMIYHDHTFSLLDRQQMDDRQHRGAQDRTCFYFNLIMSPIDEAQLAALTKKTDIASAVVDAVRAMRGPGTP